MGILGSEHHKVSVTNILHCHRQYMNECGHVPTKSSLQNKEQARTDTRALDG